MERISEDDLIFTTMNFICSFRISRKELIILNPLINNCKDPTKGSFLCYNEVRQNNLMKLILIGLIAVIICQNPTARNTVADGLQWSANTVRGF